MQHVLRVVLIWCSIMTTSSTPICAVSPFIFSNIDQVFGCGVERCICPFNNLLYTCNSNTAEEGVCGLSGGGFPLTLAVVVFTMLFAMLCYYLVGCCRGHRVKRSKAPANIEESSCIDSILSHSNTAFNTANNVNNAAFSMDQIKSLKRIQTITGKSNNPHQFILKNVPNPNWDTLKTTFRGNLELPHEVSTAENSTRATHSASHPSNTSVMTNAGSPMFEFEMDLNIDFIQAIDIESQQQTTTVEELNDTGDWSHLIDYKELNTCQQGTFSSRNESIIKLETLNDWRLKALIAIVFTSFVSALWIVLSPIDVQYSDTVVPFTVCNSSIHRASVSSSNSRWLSTPAQSCWSAIDQGTIAAPGSTTLKFHGDITSNHYNTDSFAVLLDRINVPKSSVRSDTKRNIQMSYSVTIVESESNATLNAVYSKSIDCDCNIKLLSSELCQCDRAYLFSIRMRTPNNEPLALNSIPKEFQLSITFPFANQVIQPQLVYEQVSSQSLTYNIIIMTSLLLTMVSMYYYGIRLYRLPRQQITKEQILILIYSVATFLNINIITGVLIWLNSSPMWVLFLSGCIKSIGTGVSFIVILLIMNGLRYTKYPHFRHKPAFYAMPTLLGLASTAVAISIRWISISQGFNELFEGINTQKLYYLGFMEQGIVLLFLVYSLYLFLSSARKMSRLDQVKSRYRQLAFRQFWYQFLYTSVLMVFIVARSIESVSNSRYISQYPFFNSFIVQHTAEAIVSAVNTLVFCYTFLPVRGMSINTSIKCQYVNEYQSISEYKKSLRSKKPTENMPTSHPPQHQSINSSVSESAAPSTDPAQPDRVFCVQTAVLLYNASVLSYDMKIKLGGSKELQKMLGMKLIHIIHEPELNNRVLIFLGQDVNRNHFLKRKKKIIIAFRGTIDNTQLTTVDMDIQLTPFEFDIVNDATQSTNMGQTITDGMRSVRSDQPRNQNPVDRHETALHVHANTNATTTTTSNAGMGSPLVTSQEHRPLVHHGFYKSYAKLRQELHQVLTQAMANNTIDDILFTGHSLGGSLATLAAMDLKVALKEYNLHFEMYNFGAPRTGDRLFQSQYDALVPLSFRMVVDGDFIVGTPYRQSFVPLLCGQEYHHIGSAVVLDPSGTGAFIVGPNFVESTIVLRSYRKLRSHLLSTYGIALQGVVCACPQQILTVA